jgi:hypothetical protein
MVTIQDVFQAPAVHDLDLVRRKVGVEQNSSLRHVQAVILEAVSEKSGQEILRSDSQGTSFQLFGTKEKDDASRGTWALIYINAAESDNHRL